MKKAILSTLLIPLILYSCNSSIFAKKFGFVSYDIKYTTGKKEDFSKQKIYNSETELIEEIKDRLISDGTSTYKREDQKIYFDNETYNRGEEYFDDEGKYIQALYRVNRHNLDNEIIQLCFFAQLGNIFHFYQKPEKDTYRVSRFLILDKNKHIDDFTYSLELKDKEIKYQNNDLILSLDANFTSKKEGIITPIIDLELTLIYR